MQHQLVDFFLSERWQNFKVSANVIQFESHRLKIEYIIQGKIELLSLTGVDQNGHVFDLAKRTEGLWQDTCFEFFISSKDSSKYFEYNFAPNGCWDAYSFSEYRKREVEALQIENPKCTLLHVLQGSSNSSQVKCIVEFEVPHILSQNVCEYSITAVTRMKSGEVGYWAIHHNGEKPDFHLRNSFVGKLSLNHQS